MDVGLVSGLLSAQTARLQMAVAARMMQMSAVSGQSVVQLIDAAQQNAKSLANVATGIGGNLDMSV
ncbi:MAG TPA: hypothetical protein VNQ56_17240 [Pseudolabrys sp.]|nr:hypothetical protein [Pseudolabrys sp.]